MNVELTTYVTANQRFEAVKGKIADLLDYMRKAGKTPEKVQVFPGDYRALSGFVNRALARAERARVREENARRKAARIKEKDVAKPDKVEAITFNGIPVVQGAGYSRPRKFEA